MPLNKILKYGRAIPLTAGACAVQYASYLLPRNITPFVNDLLGETKQLLGHAERIGAVPPQSKYQSRLDESTMQFAKMRMESNKNRGTFRQLRIAMGGLTYKLIYLYYHIESIKSDLELQADQQLINGGENGA